MPDDAGGVPRRWLLAVGAAVAALYLAGVVNAWWPTPDSALYQCLGRNLIAGRGYVFNGQGHTTVTPGLPVLLGLTERLAGPRAIWAKNLLMCLAGLAGLAVAYAVLRRMVQPRLAFAAVVAAGLCGVYYLHSHLILTDAPFALLFWAVVYCGWRMLAGSWAWAAAVAALSAVAIAVRLPGLTVLGPLAIAFAVEKFPAPAAKRLAVGGVILAVIIAAAGAFYIIARNIYSEPSLYLTYHFAEDRGVLFRLGQLATLVTRLPETAGELFTNRQGTLVTLLGSPLLALIAVGLARLWRRGLRIPALTIVLSAMTMVLSAGIIAAKARYYVPLLPLVALGLLEGVVATVEWVRRRRNLATSPQMRARVVLITLAVIAAVNAPALARLAFYYSYQAHRGRYLDVIEGGAYADLYATAEYLRQNVRPGEKVLVRPDRVNMLHLLGGKVIDPMYDFGVNNPWNAEQADTAYRDLLAKPAVDVVVDDPGGLDARYTGCLMRLLDTTGGLRPERQVGAIRIYRRTGELVPSTGPGL
jgi:4-amino-4-deoxy-L-arabinose transferase-like glycosyltransferase